MAKAHYIVTVGGGKCLENTQSAHGVLDCIPKESESQQWLIETDEADPNIVSFKSCADGQYLRNNEPARIVGGRIGMGEKQWWTLEKGKNPGSCLIRSNACTTGASYLNDFEGKYRDQNYVHMWSMDKQRQFWLDWYILPADATFTGVISAGESKESAKDGAKQTTEELDSREADLEKREQNLAKQEQKIKDLDAREADLEKREQSLANKAQKVKDLDAKEAELEKREQSLAKQDSRVKDLDAREAEVKEKEQNLAEREAALNEAGTDGVATPKAPAEKSGSNNAANSTATSSEGSVPTQDADDELNSLKLENENLQLKLKIQDLEQQLKKAANPPKKTNSSKPRHTAPSTVNGSVSAKREPVVYECGHVAYPPPRKLRRHAVGMLYEGLNEPFELSERQRATIARQEH